eukprot:SAG31_NODE_646_length_13223_cov_14.088845_4_plen_602_part_00
MPALARPVSYRLCHSVPVDTWNRDTKYGDPFKPGPESSASAAPLTGPDAVYAGHLECPCTDRIIKTVENIYATQATGKCAGTVATAAECFASAAKIGVPRGYSNATVNSANEPAGCSLFTPDGKNYKMTFNSDNGATTECGSGSKEGGPRKVGVSTSIITFEADVDAGKDLATLTLIGPANVWFGVGLGATQMKDAPNAIIVLGNGTVFEQKLGDQQAGSLLPFSLTVVSNTVSDGKRIVVVTRPLKGKTAGHFTFNPVAQNSINYINAVGKGPDFAYHQARAASMVDLHLVGAPTCVCNTGQHAFISSDKNPQPEPFSKSCKPEPSGDLLVKKNPTCTIEQYRGGLKCCKSHNILLDKDQNPWPDNKLTCALYTSPPPPPPCTHRLFEKPPKSSCQQFTDFMKFRFWFQDYVPASSDGKTPASHRNLVRFFKETEADAGEYDVVKAPEGTKPEDTIYQITAHFQVRDGLAVCNPRTSPHCAGEGVANSGVDLIYASCHCHAPACVSCELWNADTGELICEQIPVYGQSKHLNETNKYDEEGYVAIPPCLFGPESEGLYQAPYLQYNTNLTAIKKNNNTYDHYGEMAMWQMRAAQAYTPIA